MIKGSHLITSGELPGSISLCIKEFGNKQSIKGRILDSYTFNLYNLIRHEVVRKTTSDLRMICLLLRIGKYSCLIVI